MKEGNLSIIQVQTNHSSINELLSEIHAVSREQNTLIQAFDPEAVLSKEHLLYSLSQAFKACEERRNIAKTPENEFLLRTAATRKISEAIIKTGVKTTKNVLLAISITENSRAKKTNTQTGKLEAKKTKPANEKKIDEILEQLGAKKTKLSFPDEKTIAKLYELNENALKNYSAKQLLFEKIALLNLED